MIVDGVGAVFLKTDQGKRRRIYRQSIKRGIGAIRDGRIDIESMRCPENAGTFFIQGDSFLKDKNRLNISPVRLYDIFHTLVFAENYQINRNITL